MPDIDIPQNFEFNIEVEFAADGSLLAVVVPAGPDLVTVSPDPGPVAPDPGPVAPDPGPVAPDPGPVAPDAGVVDVVSPPDATSHQTISVDPVAEPMALDGGWFF